jgi:hypothetical protein
METLQDAGLQLAARRQRDRAALAGRQDAVHRPIRARPERSTNLNYKLYLSTCVARPNVIASTVSADGKSRDLSPLFALPKQVPRSDARAIGPGNR